MYFGFQGGSAACSPSVLFLVSLLLFDNSLLLDLVQWKKMKIASFYVLRKIIGPHKALFDG